ncbi:MAG: hypothetical protein WB440_15925 [Steroidobacteraceae bacterium]|jgi:hypothetical protein
MWSIARNSTALAVKARILTYLVVLATRNARSKLRESQGHG